MQEKMNREDCIAALCEKAKELERLPRKADFSENVAAKIKSHLGPWPRALEASGLKPSKPEAIEEKNLKRIKAKRKKIEALKQQK